MTKKWQLPALFLISGILVYGVLQKWQLPQDGPEWSKFANGKRVFPNVELVTHEGKKVRFYDDLVKDQLVFVNFMYTRCDDK